MSVSRPILDLEQWATWNCLQVWKQISREDALSVKRAIPGLRPLDESINNRDLCRLFTQVSRSRALNYGRYLQQAQGDEGEFADIDQFSRDRILEGQIVSLYVESADLGHSLTSTRAVCLT
jgi:hypothetical protein